MLKELEPLAAQFTRSRENVYASLARLNDAQMLELLPGRDWSIQDTLAHLASNQELMVELLGDIVAGTRGTLPDDFDNQRFNDEHVAQGRGKSSAQVRAALDASYARLNALLETIPAAALTRRGTHPAAGDADVKEFLLAMYAHHEMHCRDVVEQTRRLTKG
jgi:hypothetical protein